MDRKKITAKVLKKLGGSSGELLREFDKQEDEKTAGGCGNPKCKCNPCECGDKCKCGYTDKKAQTKQRIKEEIKKRVLDVTPPTNFNNKKQVMDYFLNPEVSYKMREDHVKKIKDQKLLKDLVLKSPNEQTADIFQYLITDDKLKLEIIDADTHVSFEMVSRINDDKILKELFENKKREPHFRLEALENYLRRGKLSKKEESDLEPLRKELKELAKKSGKGWK